MPNDDIVSLRRNSEIYLIAQFMDSINKILGGANLNASGEVWGPHVYKQSDKEKPSKIDPQLSAEEVCKRITVTDDDESLFKTHLSVHGFRFQYANV